MLVSTIIERISYKLEDPSKNIYLLPELIHAVNEAKDEVLSLVTILTDQMPQIAIADVTLGAGVSEVELGFATFGIIRAEDQDGNPHTFKDFRAESEFRNDLEAEDLYIRWAMGSSQVPSIPKMYIGRHGTSSKALVLTIYYVNQISDAIESQIDSTYFLFAPPPSANLIITKATLSLLASRNRRNRRFEEQEKKQEGILSEVLAQLNKTNAEYVHYVED